MAGRGEAASPPKPPLEAAKRALKPMAPRAARMLRLSPRPQRCRRARATFLKGKATRSSPAPVAGRRESTQRRLQGKRTAEGATAE